MELQFSQVTKSFGDLNVIRQFDTTIRNGEIVALVGPSGCGKSTLLHMLAGLQQPSTGTLTAGGASVARPSPERTLVFQEHALYPWMTLLDNVALALEFRTSPAIRPWQRLVNGCPESGLSVLKTITPIRFPEACDSVAPWPGPLSPAPRYCCWTNLSAPWMR